MTDTIDVAALVERALANADNLNAQHVHFPAAYALRELATALQSLSAELAEARRLIGLFRLEQGHNGNLIAALTTRATTAEAEARAMREALEAARTWHEAEDKALSKQPPSHGPNGNQWARLQHQEQIAEINRALEATGQASEGQDLRRLGKLVRVFLDNNPDELVADSGETVLDLFRYEARRALGGSK